ncbi:MAG: hypothetical protein HY861_00775 [Chlamydiia bacterium]|nr:hypothetical protein [Chlamydiia bacterium]
MHSPITSQQAAFFTQNGYIELTGIPFQSENLFASGRKALASRTPSPQSGPSPAQLYAFGRDLWRDDDALRTLLIRKLAPAASGLVSKSMRLACDQWMPAHFPWDKAYSLKDLFCIQGLVLGALFCASPAPSALPPSPLGILPFPTTPAGVLFVKPHILLNWPLLTKLPPMDIYLGLYALTNAVYVHNPKDPSTHSLKQLGYQFGDVLQNRHHPLITP